MSALSIMPVPAPSGPIRSRRANPLRQFRAGRALSPRVAGFALTAAPTLIALVFAGGNAAMLLSWSKQWMSLR